VGILKALLRAYSYIFEGLLALFVLALSLLALSSGNSLNLKFLPWTGRSLSYWLLVSALAGLLFLLMAMGGKVRALFFLWSLAVFVMLFRGFFLTSYLFSGPVKFKPALCLTLAALFGAVGAWPWRKREPVRRRELY
jgi:hypothetical protein